MKKYYCDICGREATNVKVIKLCVSTNGFFKNQKKFEICNDCEERLTELQNNTEVNFVKESKWWKGNSDESNKNEINYGSFELSGTFEQGGYVCPKCGYCNNAYSFNGICKECGYGYKFEE